MLGIDDTTPGVTQRSYCARNGMLFRSNDADGEVPAKLRKKLHQALNKIDSAALKTGCFGPMRP